MCLCYVLVIKLVVVGTRVVVTHNRYLHDKWHLNLLRLEQS